MRYLFRGEQQPDLTTPWPVLVGDDGAIITGRPDAHALVGFQRGMKLQIARSFEEALADPKWIVGKFPVYSYAFDEGLFVVLERIELMQELPDNIYANTY